MGLFVERLKFELLIILGWFDRGIGVFGLEVVFWWWVFERWFGNVNLVVGRLLNMFFDLKGEGFMLLFFWFFFVEVL